MLGKEIKIIIAVTFVLTVIVVVLLFLMTNPLTTTQFAVQNLKFRADPERLKTHVASLSEIDPPRNYENVASLQKAADYIKTELEKYCPEVDEQVFEVEKEQYRNIICLFGPKDELRVVVGAHYDAHLSSGVAADDNASGVAGLIELARLIKENETDLQNQIELVAYNFEEPPYFRTENMGSYIHAKSLKDEKVELKYMISLEMIGYFSDQANSQKIPSRLLQFFYPTTGNFIALIGRFGKDSFMNDLKAKMKTDNLPVYSLNAPEYMLTGYSSDQLNYWKFGYDAAVITDTGPFRNPNYHKSTDTPETLNYDKMAEVVNRVYIATAN
ncbi:M28 family peptidase [Candidatus Woesebacteria bacterium]|nr:M28 family peptidase [Candidatus Woesebacteria bacterium]